MMERGWARVFDVEAYNLDFPVDLRKLILEDIWVLNSE